MDKINWSMRACGIFLLWATAAVALPAQTPAGVPPAQTFTTFRSVALEHSAHPSGGLIQGTDGNLYGTTSEGGGNGCPTKGADHGCGTVFKITPSGQLTTLHSFDGVDGRSPNAGLVLGTHGDFYGTTFYGGANVCTFGRIDYGCGTIFKITPSGTLTTVYNFCSNGSYPNCQDGFYPDAALVQGTHGNFYGTTVVGGNFRRGGTVFTVTPNGALTTLYNFCSQSNCTDGDTSVAGLIQATDGNFYGTTSGGGSHGAGSVFKITPHGAVTTVYSFCSETNCSDGASPVAGLIQATDGNFYGTTEDGGSPNCCGVVFKLTPGGVLTTLYDFCSQGGNHCTDGDFPEAGLIQGTDGNLYGTTRSGGANGGYGTVFKITLSGTLTTLHSFDNTDGADPFAGLVEDTNGTFYGTTYYGGGGGRGTIFSLSVGLGPFVETQPTVGKVGTAVKILGTDLTDATSVTFNGTAATFTVKSQSEITTTVPTGATTGKVRVTFPHGTRSSNVPFRVK
jgi:uncharacterized repeat protein (TIGR03803 family)